MKEGRGVELKAGKGNALENIREPKDGTISTKAMRN